MENRKIFKERGRFYVAAEGHTDFDAARGYNERALRNYLINEAPNILVDVSALESPDKQMVFEAYHKGRRIAAKKSLGV